MSLAILFHFLCVQHVSDINISIIRSLLVVSVLQAEAVCNTDTTSKPSPTKSPTHNESRKKTTDVVIQQHSRKLLMMDILMSETC